MCKVVVTGLILTMILLFSAAEARENLLLVRPSGMEQVHITIDPQAHIDYGFSHPLTFAFSLPSYKKGLRAWYRYGSGHPWLQLPEKNSGDFFNGIAAVRFDEAIQTAFVSVGFSAVSDSLLLMITTATREPVPMVFSRICAYYDDRSMAVTASADDMAGWSKAKFERALHITRAHNLWVSCGVNSGGADANVYRYIQAQLDSGFVEASCHSRSHPSLPYKDYRSEITGNKEDIVKNLRLPASFSSGEREYVYLWIAPNGRTNAIIDSFLTLNKFLFNRLYTSDFFGFSGWNDQLAMFTNAGVTRAFDPPASQLGWGIGTNNINDLNSAFDKAMTDHSVYHVMCHPNVVEWDKSYPWQHLAYISNRTDVWYVAVGHLYLYHLAQISYQAESAVAVHEGSQPEGFALQQNYPNPFNPETTICYTLSSPEWVELAIYNSIGERVALLVKGMQGAGEHRLVWQAGKNAAGVYFCRLQGSEGVQTRKMLLVR